MQQYSVHCPLWELLLMRTLDAIATDCDPHTHLSDIKLDLEEAFDPKRVSLRSQVLWERV